MSEVFTPWQRFCMWFCNRFAGWYLERQKHKGSAESWNLASKRHIEPLMAQVDSAESAVIAWQMKCHELDGLLEEAQKIVCIHNCGLFGIPGQPKPHCDLCKRLTTRMESKSERA